MTAHVLLTVSRSWPGGQLVQVVLALLQVAQVASHVAQATPLLRKVPSGHVPTHALPPSTANGVADAGLHESHDAGPLQVPHVLLHDWQALPSE